MNELVVAMKFVAVHSHNVGPIVVGCRAKRLLIKLFVNENANLLFNLISL